MRSRFTTFGLVLSSLAACVGTDSSAISPAKDSDSGGTPDGGSDDVVVGTSKPSLKVSYVGEGYATQGKTTPFPIKIERSSFDDDVIVTFTGLPAGMTSAPATIQPGQTEGVVSLTVPESLAQGPLGVTVDARSEDGKVTATLPVEVYVRGKAGTFDVNFGDGGFWDFPALEDFVNLGNIAALGNRVVATAGFSKPAIASFLPKVKFDPAFGPTGVVQPGAMAGEIARAVAVAADGKVVVVNTKGSSTRAHRLAVDGALDATFGSSGSTTVPIPDANQSPTAVAVQPDGRIVVIERAEPNWVVARLDALGTLDPTFAGTGIARGSWVSGGGRSEPLAVWTVANGGILFAGGTVRGAAGSRQDEFAVTRLLNDGSPDPSFAGTGSLVVPPSAAANRVLTFSGSWLRADGSTVVAANGSTELTTVAVKGDGTPDPSHGAGGVLSGTTPGGGSGSAVAASNNDKMLVFGSNPPKLTRLTTARALDVEFGAQGSTSLERGYLVGSAKLVEAGEYIYVLLQWLPDDTGTKARSSVVRLWR